MAHIIRFCVPVNTDRTAACRGLAPLLIVLRFCQIRRKGRHRAGHIFAYGKDRVITIYLNKALGLEAAVLKHIAGAADFTVREAERFCPRQRVKLVKA